MPAVAALCLALAACGSNNNTSTPTTADAPRSVPESSITTLLLSPAQLNEVMGTTNLVAQPLVDRMDDHRNMLPNENCLGVWQIDESKIYGDKTYTAVRQQTLRTPDTDQWDALVAQSAVIFPNADGAHKFFTEWSSPGTWCMTSSCDSSR